MPRYISHFSGEISRGNFRVIEHVFPNGRVSLGGGEGGLLPYNSNRLWWKRIDAFQLLSNYYQISVWNRLKYPWSLFDAIKSRQNAFPADMASSWTMKDNRLPHRPVLWQPFRCSLPHRSLIRTMAGLRCAERRVGGRRRRGHAVAMERPASHGHSAHSPLPPRPAGSGEAGDGGVLLLQVGGRGQATPDQRFLSVFPLLCFKGRDPPTHPWGAPLGGGSGGGDPLFGVNSGVEIFYTYAAI